MPRFMLEDPRRVHNLLICTYSLCMDYVIKRFLLVSSTVRSKQLLCFVYGQDKKANENIQQQNFFAFHNHSSMSH